MGPDFNWTLTLPPWKGGGVGERERDGYVAQGESEPTSETIVQYLNYSGMPPLHKTTEYWRVVHCVALCHLQDAKIQRSYYYLVFPSTWRQHILRVSFLFLILYLKKKKKNMRKKQFCT